MAGPATSQPHGESTMSKKAATAASPLEELDTTPSGLDLEAFAIDEQKESEGVWIPIAGGVEFLIARANNPNYLKALTSFYKVNRAAVDRQLMEDGEADDIMCKILAETVFLGFRGELRLQGAVQTDTVVNRAKIMKNFKALREEVVRLSNESELYQAAEEVAAGESSSDVSAGS